MRVLVLGHTGMLGSDVMKVYDGYDIHGLSIGDFDIANYHDAKSKISEIAPDIVINCAAYTDVDRCETDTITAFAVNALGVKNIANVCREIKARLVHISTDYVFDGQETTPYKENHETAPICAYGNSKLEGEEFLKNILDEYLIVRTQWLFGRNGKNFVTTMLRLSDTLNEMKVVDEQFGSPTYTKDLASAIKVMLDKGLCGIYHVSNSDFTSWYGFAVKIFEYTKKDIQVSKISSDELKRAAKRPAYSVFNLSKLYKDTGIKMPAWEDGLYRYLEEKKLI